MPFEREFLSLGLELFEVLKQHEALFGRPRPVLELPQWSGSGDLPDFVLDSEAGLLPGEPPSRSLSLAWPLSAAMETSGLAWTFGPSLQQAAAQGRTCDFVQIVLTPVGEALTRPLLSRVNSLRSLAGILPGYMAHTMGSETSGRIHSHLLQMGLSMDHLARAHATQAMQRGFGMAPHVVMGVASPKALELLVSFGQRAKALAAQLSDAAAAQRVEGQEGCDGRECGTCDDKDVCDKVRAVLAAHAAASREGGRM